MQRRRSDLAKWARWMPGWLLRATLWVLALISLPIMLIQGMRLGALEWWETLKSESSVLKAMLQDEKAPGD